MAKGQKKSNKEARKPKAEKTKTIAANPSTKEGVVRGLENIKRKAARHGVAPRPQWFGYFAVNAIQLFR